MTKIGLQNATCVDKYNMGMVVHLDLHIKSADLQLRDMRHNFKSISNEFSHGLQSWKLLQEGNV